MIYRIFNSDIYFLQYCIVHAQSSVHIRSLAHSLIHTNLSVLQNLMRKFNVFISWIISEQSTSKQAYLYKFNPIQSKGKNTSKLNVCPRWCPDKSDDDTISINCYCFRIWSNVTRLPCCCWYFQHYRIKWTSHWNARRGKIGEEHFVVLTNTTWWYRNNRYKCDDYFD